MRSENEEVEKFCYVIGIAIAIGVGMTQLTKESTSAVGASELRDCLSTVTPGLHCSGTNGACHSLLYLAAVTGGTSPNAVDVTYLGAAGNTWQCTATTNCVPIEPFTYKQECKGK
jgi:hypothetical protein